MPWHGPEVPGEFPTLGYLIGEWIEEFCIIPDGPRMGVPYRLTGEMWRHLLWAYRLRPDAREEDGPDAFVYSGSLLVRPQKWGKDPFNAARCIDRKSTRLNSSHVRISYAVFCLKKKIEHRERALVCNLCCLLTRTQR